MELLVSISAFVFGVLIGSFLNVVILRLPNDEGLGGRSHCPKCKRELKVLDLVPIFSYLFLTGKCRGCSQKISPRYLLIEIITGLLFLFSYLYISPQSWPALVLLLKFWIILSVLLAVFVIDLEHFLILDNIILPAGIFVLALNFILSLLNHNQFWNFSGVFVSSLIAAILACLPFFGIWYFSKGQWMGFGDVKLALFLGVALGFPNVFVGLMAAILLGGAVSSLLLLFTNSNLKTKLPFGTFLAVGSGLSLFFGPVLLKWYLSIMGF